MVSRVLDSSAFYAGIPFSSNEGGNITSLVYNEIEHIKKVHDAFRSDLYCKHSLREIKLLRYLEHENIIKLLKFSKLFLKDCFEF